MTENLKALEKEHTARRFVLIFLAMLFASIGGNGDGGGTCQLQRRVLLYFPGVEPVFGVAAVLVCLGCGGISAQPVYVGYVWLVVAALFPQYHLFGDGFDPFASDCGYSHLV